MSINLFEAVFSATSKHIDVFYNLYGKAQRAENLLKILALSTEKLDLCRSIVVFDIEMIDKIASLNDKQSEVFESLAVEDQTLESLNAV